MCDAIAPFPVDSIQVMKKRTSLMLLRKQLRGAILLNKNHFTFSIISPYFNTLQLHKIIIRIKLIVFLETLFNKNAYRIEASQLICNTNQLTSFYASVSIKEFLDIQATVEYVFTLKRVHDMMRTVEMVYSLKWQASFRRKDKNKEEYWKSTTNKAIIV